MYFHPKKISSVMKVVLRKHDTDSCILLGNGED